MKLWESIAKAALRIAGCALSLMLGVAAFVEPVAAEVPSAAMQSGAFLGSKPIPGVAETALEPEGFAADQGSALWSGTRTLGAIIFVLALILTTMVLLKRYLPHRFGRLGHKRRIQVLETVPIGDRRNLVLVEIDGSALLLATTPNSVSLLREVQPDLNHGPDTASEPLSASLPESKNPAGNQGFEEALAAEIAAPSPVQASPLARLTLIRQELETR